MSSQKDLTKYSLLSFDCFGTLVDWESGIYTGLQPLLNRLPQDHHLRNDRPALLTRYNAIEREVQSAHPAEKYYAVNALVYRRLAEELGIKDVADDEASKFGHSIGEWPAFPDTVDALQRLKKHYKLVILSNVDSSSFGNTLRGPLSGADFDAIYTAEEIGSYKPSLQNFDYLISHVKDDLNVERTGILHVAQSLYHDHEPCKKMGLPSVWIERGAGDGGERSVMGVTVNKEDVAYGWKFGTMGEFADAVEEAFSKKGSK